MFSFVDENIVTHAILSTGTLSEPLKVSLYNAFLLI